MTVADIFLGMLFERVLPKRKGSGSTGSGMVGILIIGVAKEGKMWAEGPYLHAFANLGSPPFSQKALVLIEVLRTMAVGLRCASFFLCVEVLWFFGKSGLGR